MGAVSHHYNPQVYLKQFRDPKPKKVLWEYNVQEGTARESSPKDSGCEDYYNSVALNDGTQDHDTIERFFSQLENELPALFEAIRSGSRPGNTAGHTLPAELWDVFFRFAATQESRSPQVVSTLHNFLSDVHQFAFEITKHSTGFQKALSDKGFDPELVRKGDIKVKAAKGSALLFLLEAVETAESLFRQMGWIFFVAPSGKYFFTSERPVCLWVPPDQRSLFGIGLAHRDIQITFPLSRRVCAFGRWKKANHLYEVVPENLVDAVNERCICNAKHFIYGPILDVKILEMVKARTKRLATAGEAAEGSDLRKVE